MKRIGRILKYLWYFSIFMIITLTYFDYIQIQILVYNPWYEEPIEEYEI